MSLTALLWAALYITAAVGTFVNPLLGSLGYMLEYYMRPELKWWGDGLPALRYNLIISMALGLSFLIRRGTLRPMQEVPNLPLRWLLAMAGVMILVTPTVAVNMEISWNWSVQWMKMAIIFPMLMAATLRNRLAINLFLVAHMLGAFWWGWDAWLDPHREASRLVNVGSGDSLNDNAASAHLLTVLPFTVVYLLTEKTRWMRAAGLIALPFVVNTIILCNSRGSMVGLAVAFVCSILLIRSGQRLRLMGAAVAMVGVLYFMADDQFIERQQSTTNYEEDGSAQQRLVSWKGAWRLIQDRPLGAGGRGFHLLSPIYIPEIVASHKGDLRAPHNTWAMVPSEWGVLGLVCYLGIYGSALLNLHRIKKRALPCEEGFFYWRALATQLALIAYLVAGTFTDRLYAEAGYWMVALSYALLRLQVTEQAELQPVAVSVPLQERAAPDGSFAPAYGS